MISCHSQALPPEYRRQGLSFKHKQTKKKSSAGSLPVLLFNCLLQKF